MKVIRLGRPLGLEHIRVSEMEDPAPPAPGEILVRVRASSINYHDYAVAMGWLPTAPGLIPLSDGAGLVEAVGEGVTEFKKGDRVVSCFSPLWQDGAPTIAGFSATPGDGLDGYAREWATRPASWFTHAPAHYDFAQAATLTTAGLTAWRALGAENQLKAGDTVLVQGSGGVSVFALQLAKAMGAVVIATSSSDAKLEKLKQLGADHLVNYKKTPDWGKEAQNLTGGRGVDHVVEVGGPATIGQSAEACRVGGRIALIGVLTGFEGVVPFGVVLQKQLQMQGITVGHRQHQKDFVRALESTGIVPVIDSNYPMEQLADAFRHLEAGAHFGKISIEI